MSSGFTSQYALRVIGDAPRSRYSARFYKTQGRLKEFQALANKKWNGPLAVPFLFVVNFVLKTRQIFHGLFVNRIFANNKELKTIVTMIVPSMTDLEILEEIKKDMPQINNYMAFINCGRKYRKLLQGRKPKGDRFVFVLDDWKSVRNNHYTFILSTTSLGDMKKHGFKNTFLTFIKRGNSLSSYRIVKSPVYENEPMLQVCTSHFIERYNLRFLKNPLLSHKQAVIEFYKRNDTCHTIPMPSNIHEYNNIAAFNDGYCFMKEKNEKITVMRTFISRDMLHGYQYDSADLMDESLRKQIEGLITNLSNAEAEVEKACNGEQKIPTIEDYNQCMEKIRQLHAKKASLEEVGKQFDLEYYEMRNSLTILIAGFDWLAAMLKDENGQLLRHPFDFYE